MSGLPIDILIRRELELPSSQNGNKEMNPGAPRKPADADAPSLLLLKLSTLQTFTQHLLMPQAQSLPRGIRDIVKVQMSEHTGTGVQ